MSRLTTAAVIAVIASLTLSAEALACSCAAPPAGQKAAAYRDAFKRADGAVFVKVVRRRDIAPDIQPGEASPGSGRIVLTVSVKRAYKKLNRFPRGRRFKLHTPPPAGGNCGLGARPGQKLGLLMERTRGRWTASICSTIPKRWLKRSAASRGAAASSSDAGCAASATSG